MEQEKEKFNGKRLFITIAIVVVTAALVGGSVWYVMDQQAKKDAEERAQQIVDLQKKVEEKIETTKTKKDETDDWKTFTGLGFIVKYPENWVYKDYSKLTEGANMVGFGQSEGNLAPEQSDGHSTVDVTWSAQPISTDELTGSPDKLIVKAVTINGKNANKYVLAAGRPNDMGGDSKEVIYEIKLSNGNYLVIRNVDDVESETFEKMVQTVK